MAPTLATLGFIDGGHKNLEDSRARGRGFQLITVEIVAAPDVMACIFLILLLSIYGY